MKICAIIAQKGGVGKTTLATALAVEAVAARKRALIIDIDPQANASNWSDRRALDAPVVESCMPVRLKKVVQAARDNGADWIFIDTPGSAGESAISAAEIADLVLLPLEPHLFSLETIDTMTRITGLANAQRVVVVFNKAPIRGTRHTDAAHIVRQQHRLTVAPVVVFSRAAHADAQNIGQTAREYKPNDKAALEMRALYRYISKTVQS